MLFRSFQGFVHDNPLGDDKTPANPIRRFVISPQIFNIIKNALMDPEMENMPTDYDAGLDFSIKKTSKGGYADYSTSSWARKETSLSAEEREAIDSHGLYNLADFLPKKPGEVELKVIKEMFEASVDGQAYDAERWGSYYKPAGLNTGSGSGDDDTPAAKPAAKATPAPAKAVPAAAVAEDPPFDTDDAPAASAPVAKPAGTSQRAEDILAMIRNRQKS